MRWVLCCLVLASLPACVSQNSKRSGNATDITADTQYRASLDSSPVYAPINFPPVTYNGRELPLGKPTGLFALLEVFLTNHRDHPVEFTTVLLNGEELKAFPNDRIVWWQFYPTALAKPKETVLLQICLDQAPQTPQALQFETKNGERLGLMAPAFAEPACQIAGLNFSWDMRRAFIAYQSVPSATAATHSRLVPSKVQLNGKNLERSSRLVEPSHENQPGMIAVELGQPISIGQPVHCRLEFAGDKVAHCLLRASRGMLLDAYGVDEKDENLRRELGLDLLPSVAYLTEDVACYDQPQRPGYNAPTILQERRKAFDAGDARLRSVFLCVMARPQISYPIYGQCADVLQVNPYRLQYSGRDTAPKFIEKEENFFHWAWLAARPRPWHWAPEVCLFPKRKFGRLMEPEELRLLTYAALGHGAKGIHYFAYGSQQGEYHGFQESPRLLAEIKKLNAEVRTLEPILSQAFPMSIETIGGPTEGMRLYALWSGDAGVLLIARSLAYETTREPNDMGKRPRFKSDAPAPFEIALNKPSRLDVKDVVDLLDPAGASIPHRVEGRKILLAIPSKGGGRNRVVEKSKDGARLIAS